MRKSYRFLCVVALTACTKGSLVSLPVPANGTDVTHAIAPATYALLHSFKGSPDGANPLKRLLNVGGELYGTTPIGGSGTECGSRAGCGTVFKIGQAGGESVIYSFKDYPDGALPEAGLINVKGELYGTTDSGGTSLHRGTVFKVSPSGNESVIHIFNGSPDGRNPQGSLIDVQGVLYGTTVYGGRRLCGGGCGTVYAIKPTGSEHIVYAFKPVPDGNNPIGSLTVLNGKLYGTTVAGGANGKGSVFVTDRSGAEHVIYSFKGAPDGEAPEGGVIAVNGELYGTTANGGAKSGGTVFKVSLSGKESVLYNFSNRSAPQGGLINVNGALYGTTTSGGGGFPGSGVVFKITTSGKESVVYHFKGGTDGKNPMGGLIYANGMLFGTTTWGGADDLGTVFGVSP